MIRIELVGTVDEQHQLSLKVPKQIKPGPIKVVLEIPGEEDDWAEGVAQAWAGDWSDPREDIYTLQDGDPENVTR